MPDPAEPEHVDRDVAADPFGGEEADQIVDAGHLVAVDGDDGVLTEQPAEEAGPFGSTLVSIAPVGLSMPAASACRRGTGAVCAVTPMKARRTRPCRMSSLTTKLTVLLATAKQIPCACRIIAVLTPTTSPMRRNQRPAGITGVQRRVGLDDVLDHAAGVGADRAAERGDHASGHRRLEAERIADRDDELPSAELLGIPEAAVGRSRAALARMSAISVSGSSPIN